MKKKFWSRRANIVFIAACIVMIFSMTTSFKRVENQMKSVKNLKHENDSLKIENHVKDQFIDIILLVDSIPVK